MDKLAYFIPDLRSGGAERSTLIEVNREAASGRQVDLVLARAQGSLLSELDYRVNVVDLKSKRFLSSIIPLSKYLRIEKPAIIYSQMFDSGMAAVIARLLSRHQCPIISTIRTTLSSQARETSSFSAKGIKSWLARMLAIHVHRKYIQEIRAVSEGVADDFAEFTDYPRHKIVIVRNHRDKNELLQKAAEPIAHKWYNVDTKVIIAVGRLHYAKGFDRLLAAFAIVRKDVDCKLVILGEGSARLDLTDQAYNLGIAPHVDLAGFVDNPYPFIARSSAFVLSSRREGYPGALLEACILGVDVIAVDCKSGPREILSERNIGILVPENDIEALAAAISRTLDSSHAHESPQ